MNNGKAIIFSAPSGAGKTTVVHHLLKYFDSLAFSISATTRPIRKNEKDGVDYYFLSIPQFKQKIEEEAFVEFEEVYEGRFYGTLKSEVERLWALDKVVLFDVDVIGGRNLKNFFGDQALAVFVRPPSLAILKERLIARNTDSHQDIQKRLEKATYEMNFEKDFDVALINDKLKRTFADAEYLIASFLESNT